MQNKNCGGTLTLVICVLKRVVFMQVKILQNTFKGDIKVTSYIIYGMRKMSIHK